MDFSEAVPCDPNERRAVAMKPAAAPTPAPRRFRMRLAYHLIIVLVVKVILLALLWHAFIKPNKVKVDVDAMGNRIASAASPASIPTFPGDNK
ncbi:MAG: hypothetical protein LBS49_07480 [Candidatus Accumulibacter sp.]|nr:hypothetical protein [Accumulibacter sp.]